MRRQCVKGEAGIVTPAHLTLNTEHCRLRQEAGVVTRPRPPEASVIRRHLSVHSVDSMLLLRCDIVHNARKQHNHIHGRFTCAAHYTF